MGPSYQKSGIDYPFESANDADTCHICCPTLKCHRVQGPSLKSSIEETGNSSTICQHIQVILIEYRGELLAAFVVVVVGFAHRIE